MTLFTAIALLSAMLFSPSGTLYANEQPTKLSEHFLSEWKLGETIHGDKIAGADLAGNVVVIEYWGVDCKSCLKAMPSMVKLDKQYREKGLRFVAAEISKSDASSISTVVNDLGIEFSVTKGASGPFPISGLPHVLVFGATGQLVFSGHPNENGFESAIQTEVGKASGASSIAKLSPEIAKEIGFGIKRNWKNSKGETLKAASVTKIEDDKVIFKLSDGDEVPYEIKKLSREDQKVIQALRKKKSK